MLAAVPVIHFHTMSKMLVLSSVFEAGLYCCHLVAKVPSVYICGEVIDTSSLPAYNVFTSIKRELWIARHTSVGKDAPLLLTKSVIVSYTEGHPATSNVLVKCRVMSLQDEQVHKTVPTCADINILLANIPCCSRLSVSIGGPLCLCLKRKAKSISAHCLLPFTCRRIVSSRLALELFQMVHQDMPQQGRRVEGVAERAAAALTNPNMCVCSHKVEQGSWHFKVAQDGCWYGET